MRIAAFGLGVSSASEALGGGSGDTVGCRVRVGRGVIDGGEERWVGAMDAVGGYDRGKSREGARPG